MELFTFNFNLNVFVRHHCNESVLIAKGGKKKGITGKTILFLSQSILPSA